ncbi:hypothetical protein Tco_0763596 [Tanacetum coccineum]
MLTKRDMVGHLLNQMTTSRYLYFRKMEEINDVREHVTVKTSMKESLNVKEMNVNVKLNVPDQDTQEKNVNDKSNMSTTINDNNVKNCFETIGNIDIDC